MLVVVNLDPHDMQHGCVAAAARRLGPRPPRPPSWSTTCSTDERYYWRGEWNYVRLDPGTAAHILAVQRPRSLASGPPEPLTA